MSPAPALLLAAAAIAGAVDLSDRSEVRVRDSNEPVGRVIDLETIPAAAVRLQAHTWELTLGYSPRLVLRQIDAFPMPEALHQGTLALSWRTRRALLGIQASGAYGTQSFTRLASGANPADATQLVLQRLPPASTIPYVASRAGVTVRYAATRRLALSGLAEHAMSGGTDADARAVIPFQSGPHAMLGAEYALSRTDRVTTSLDAAWVTFSSGPEDTLIEATEAWRRTFDRRTEATLRGGVTAVFARTNAADPLRARAYPVAEATLAHKMPSRRLEARFALRLAPVVDRLSGLVDERLQGTAAATWSLAPRVALRGEIGAARSVPGIEDGALTFVLWEASASFHASPWVRVDVGTRGAWQGVQGAGALPPQWVAFSSATVTLPSLRF